MKPIDQRSLWAPFLSLFTSFGTLMCCAIPALMVAIGAGAALAGLVTAVPQLVWISEHKTLVFTVAGIMIVISGILQWLNRNAPCPTDPIQAKACTRLRKTGLWIYLSSIVVYAIGFFFAFLAVRFMS